MNTGTNFHYEAATISSGVPFAFSQRYACSKVSMSVSDRASDEEESKVEFAFSSLRERIGSSLRAYRGMERVVELFGQALRPVEPKAVSAKVRAAHHAFLARCGLNAVQADS